MRLINGKRYWACICGEIHTDSTYCPVCSHKPANLERVSVSKRFFRSGTWVQIRARYLLQRDHRDKLSKVIASNREYLAKKDAVFSGAKPEHTNNSQDPPLATSRTAKYDFSIEVFEQRQADYLDAKNPSKLDKEISRPTKPSVAIELNPDSFEWYCAEWCVYLGHQNVRVTRSTKDGGIDVHGDGFIAQAKLQEIPVGVKAIRELAGLVSIRTGALGYFFTVNGYSPQAMLEGNELGLALFTLRPFSSEIKAASDLALLILEDIELSNS